MLVPQSLFPSNPSLLERHPAEVFPFRASATDTNRVAQYTVPFPPGERSIVVGTLVVDVLHQATSGVRELIDLQVNMLDGSGALVVRLARRLATNGRVGDEIRMEAMTTFGNNSRKSFNFPELRGIIIPNLYRLQIVTEFTSVSGFTSQTIDVDLMGYLIPRGLLLR